MELYEVHLKKAISFFKTADHLVYVTMPVVNDNKLFITVLDNIHMALEGGMNAVLEYERLYKRIMPLADNFESRFEVFKRMIGKHGFINDEAIIIRELKRFIEDRKEAPVEITRSDKFVICSDNYRMKTISIEEIKKYLSITKSFLLKINRIVKK